MRHAIRYCAVLVAILVAPALASYDGNITVNTSAYQFGSGGEFKITINSGYVGETGLYADPLNATTFQTFCVQKAEHLALGGVYDVNLNTVTILGNKPLVDKVAYLYQNFRYGTLQGYDYTIAANRKADAGVLQDAIWSYMGEIAPVVNKFTTLADSKVGTAAWATGSIGNVRIMNLFNGPGADSLGNNQDLLTIVPVPGAALLALIGFPIVGWLKRRLA